MRAPHLVADGIFASGIDWLVTDLSDDELQWN